MSRISLAIALSGQSAPKQTIVASKAGSAISELDRLWASILPAQKSVRGGQRYIVADGKVMTLEECALEFKAAEKKEKELKAIPPIKEDQADPRIKKKYTEDDNYGQLKPGKHPAVVVLNKKGTEGKLYEAKEVSVEQLKKNESEYALAQWCDTMAEAKRVAKQLEEGREDKGIQPSTWPATKSPQALDEKEIKELPTAEDKVNRMRRADVTASRKSLTARPAKDAPRVKVQAGQKFWWLNLQGRSTTFDSFGKTEEEAKAVMIAGLKSYFAGEPGVLEDFLGYMKDEGYTLMQYEVGHAYQEGSDTILAFRANLRVKAGQYGPDWYGEVNKANPSLSQLNRGKIGREAERLMRIEQSALEKVGARHGVTEWHRGPMDEHKGEIAREILKRVKPGVSPAVYLVLEDENFHFLNQLLTELNLWGKPQGTAEMPVAAAAVGAAYNDTWVNIYNPKTPEELGLPGLQVQSMGDTVYSPKLAFDPKDKKKGIEGLMIMFGHYYGGGTYYVSTILGTDGYGRAEGGLNLYGGDPKPDNHISAEEMAKVREWLKANQEKGAEALAGQAAKAALKAAGEKMPTVAKQTVTVVLDDTKATALAKKFGYSLEHDIEDYGGGYYSAEDAKKMSLPGKYSGAEELFPHEVSMAAEDADHDSLSAKIVDANKDALVEALEGVDVSGSDYYDDGLQTSVRTGNAKVVSASWDDQFNLTIVVEDPIALFNWLLAGVGMFATELEIDEPMSEKDVEGYLHLLKDYYAIMGDSKPEISDRLEPDPSDEDFEYHLDYRLKESGDIDVAAAGEAILAKIDEDFERPPAGDAAEEEGWFDEVKPLAIQVADWTGLNADEIVKAVETALKSGSPGSAKDMSEKEKAGQIRLVESRRVGSILFLKAKGALRPSDRRLKAQVVNLEWKHMGQPFQDWLKKEWQIGEAEWAAATPAEKLQAQDNFEATPEGRMEASKTGVKAEGTPKIRFQTKWRDLKKKRKAEHQAPGMETCFNCGKPLDPEKGEVFLTDEGGIFCADDYPEKNLKGGARRRRSLAAGGAEAPAKTHPVPGRPDVRTLEPMTAEEVAEQERLVSEAADGDPGEEGEAEVLRKYRPRASKPTEGEADQLKDMSDPNECAECGRWFDADAPGAASKTICSQRCAERAKKPGKWGTKEGGWTDKEPSGAEKRHGQAMRDVLSGPWGKPKGALLAGAPYTARPMKKGPKFDTSTRFMPREGLYPSGNPVKAQPGTSTRRFKFPTTHRVAGSAGLKDEIASMSLSEAAYEVWEEMSAIGAGERISAPGEPVAIALGGAESSDIAVLFDALAKHPQMPPDMAPKAAAIAEQIRSGDDWDAARDFLDEPVFASKKRQIAAAREEDWSWMAENIVAAGPEAVEAYKQFFRTITRIESPMEMYAEMGRRPPRDLATVNARLSEMWDVFSPSSKEPVDVAKMTALLPEIADLGAKGDAAIAKLSGRRASLKAGENGPAPDAVAKEFAKVLKEWLTPEEIAEVVSDNKAEQDPNVCHSHDHCDANMAMDEAFQNLDKSFYDTAWAENDASNFNDEPGPLWSRMTDIWNEAWGIAKKADFWADGVKARLTKAERMAEAIFDTPEFKAILRKHLRPKQGAGGFDKAREAVADYEATVKPINSDQIRTRLVELLEAVI